MCCQLPSDARLLAPRFTGHETPRGQVRASTTDTALGCNACDTAGSPAAMERVSKPGCRAPVQAVNQRTARRGEEKDERKIGVTSSPDGAKPIQARHKATLHPGSFQSTGCILKKLSPTGNPHSLSCGTKETLLCSAKERVCPHTSHRGAKTTELSQLDSRNAPKHPSCASPPFPPAMALDSVYWLLSPANPSQYMHL